MKKLFSQEQFENSKSKEKLPLECLHCKNVFLRSKQYIRNCSNPTQNNTGEFCSPLCGRIFRSPPIFLKCTNCNKDFKKCYGQIKKSKNNFCSRHCNGVYHNAHYKTGTKRSKLESWIELQLTALYPTLKIHFNRKDAINAELDIYIPSLSLAFELNGIFHYKPIYGQDRLDATKITDKYKIKTCFEKGIKLYVIDVSKQKKFNILTSKAFLETINKTIMSLAGYAPASQG